MGLLDWLFGKKQKGTSNQKVNFTFVVYDEDEQIEINEWYQKATWNNTNFIKYSGTWDTDWKRSDEGKVKVVGLSRGNRTEDFIRLACSNDFKMYLEEEPENPVNGYARKVMASARVNGELISRQIGYLPDEIATKYAGVELDIRPDTVFLPTSSDLNVGVQVALLVRSARYLKGAKKI